MELPIDRVNDVPPSRKITSTNDFYRLPCNYCFKWKLDSVLCLRCNSVYYCNDNCAKMDWKYGSEAARQFGITDGSRHKFLCKKPPKDGNFLGFDDPSFYIEEFKESNIFDNNKIELLLNTFKMSIALNRLPQRTILEKFVSNNDGRDNEDKLDEMANFKLHALKASMMESIPGIGNVFSKEAKVKKEEKLIFRKFPPTRLKFYPGKAYIAYPQIDPLQFLLSDVMPDTRNISINGNVYPPMYFAFDCYPHIAARNFVINHLIRDSQVSARTVFQIWFSTTLSKKNYDILMDTCKTLLMENGAEMKESCKDVLEFWMNFSKPLEFVVKNWSKNLRVREFYLLNCLKNPRDRLDYAKYLFNGEIFFQKPGSQPNPTFVIMGVDEEFIETRDTIFSCLDLEITKKYKDNLFKTIEEYLKERLDLLRYALKNDKVIYEYHSHDELASLNNPNIIRIIKTFETNVIDWSNLIDFFPMEEFFKFLNNDGYEAVLNICHTNNWHNNVFGATLQDFVIAKSLYNQKGVIETFLNNGKEAKHSKNMKLLLKACINLSLCDRSRVINSYKNFLKPYGVNGSLTHMMRSVLALHFRGPYFQQLQEMTSKYPQMDLIKIDDDRQWQIFVKDEVSTMKFFIASCCMNRQFSSKGLIEKYTYSKTVPDSSSQTIAVRSIPLNSFRTLQIQQF